MKQTKQMIVMLAICVVALQHHNHIRSAQSSTVKSAQGFSKAKTPVKDIMLFPSNMLWDF